MKKSDSLTKELRIYQALFILILIIAIVCSCMITGIIG